MSRLCPYCEGGGCEECDQTGRRYRECFEVDGIQVAVSGSGDGLKPELRAAFASIAKAAIAEARQEWP